MWLRTIKWTALGLGGLLFVFAAIVVYDLLSRRHYERLEAKTWHLDFGDQAYIGGHRITLPANWWAKPIQSDGTVIVSRVDESLINDSGSAIVAHPAPVTFASDEEVLVGLRSFTLSDSAMQRSLIHLQTRRLTFHCRRELVITHEFEYLCFAANFPYELRCVGNEKHEQEAVAVLKTVD